jgi:hypothetical protein
MLKISEKNWERIKILIPIVLSADNAFDDKILKKQCATYNLAL